MLGFTLTIAINSMYGIQETVRHRMLCAHVMTRGRSRTRHSRQLTDSGCATFFPSGSGSSIAWESQFPVMTDHTTDEGVAENGAPIIEVPASKVAYVTTYGGCPGADDTVVTGVIGDENDPDGNGIGGIGGDTNPDGSPITATTTVTATSPDGSPITNGYGVAATSGIAFTADNPNFVDTAAVLKHSIACTIPGTQAAIAHADEIAAAALNAVVLTGTGGGQVTTTGVTPGTTTTTTATTTTNAQGGEVTTQTGSVGVVVTEEPPTMYAFIPADSVTCTTDEGIVYDRALVLQNLGYYVKVWDTPISPEDLAEEEGASTGIISEAITDDDYTNLSKLQALKLVDHEFVVVLDQNFILKKPLDVVFDYLETTNDIAAYTTDPTTGAVDTSMLILKPNQETFDTVIDEFYNTPYDPINGWDNADGTDLIPNTDLGPGGILKYVLENPDLPGGIELDRCIYSNNADDTCNTAPYDEIVGYSLSNDICGQPWMCTYDTDQNGWSDETVTMCDTFLKHWVTLRTDFAQNSFNQEVAVTDGDYHIEIYHGLCNGQGPENFIPVLTDVPELVNCQNGSMEFHGCDPSFGTDEVSPVGSGAEIALNIDFPQQCDVFYAPPGVNGRMEIDFSGTAEIRTSGNPDTSMVFVIDRSGSTCDVPNLGCALDENLDFQVDDVLDCEILSILGLIDKVRAEGTVSHVGLVSFSSLLNDIQPATIELPLTDINIMDSNLVHAIENSIRAIDCGGATNYAAGVEKACEVIDASTTEDNVVVFISDGLPTRGGAPANFCNKKTIFHTIALGEDTTCNSVDTPTSLAKIAASTEGTCQEVENVPEIRLILKQIADTKFMGVTGSTHATESSVNFGCTDYPDYTNALQLGCEFLAPLWCGKWLAGDEYADNNGVTGDRACCGCGGGLYNDFGDLTLTPSDVVNPNTLAATTYARKATVHPGEHTVCTSAQGQSAGVVGMNVQCKQVLVCNHPDDY